MKQAIILDGFHKGYRVNLPILNPRITLPKPVTHTVCDCGELTSTFDHPSGDCYYEVAYRSMDGDIALYTQDGKPDALLSNRDWIVLDNKYRHLRPTQPLFEDAYINCHDPRAWITPDKETPEPNPKEVARDIIKRIGEALRESDDPSRMIQHVLYQLEEIAKENE